MNKYLLISLVAVTAAIAGYSMMGESFNLMNNEVKVTQYEYQECHRALKCKDMECEQSDKQCNADASRQSACELSSQVCKNAKLDFERMSGDDYMTDNYYACAKQCGPNDSNKVSKSYFEIYECEALCGGVPLYD